ncbi:maturation protein [ssRNA phage Zoerhiza.1_28]|uniref:Maturation protein n=2 Tax=Leviviricetes TaxID=2842243 RepID=A0A8S5L2U5_9VIRU|nr:maturation protein [ssRNA phage Zoerhiza.1_28]QDH88845.1 MAG: hypothetical protein H1Rhizo26FD425_000004 [Leviviridae sp.]DAD51677.1 TPA_asm: maturation protein [ssRNA phage Zoerhiza.1_28]
MTLRHRGTSRTEPKGTGVWTFFGSTLTIGGQYPIFREVHNCDDSEHSPDNGVFEVHHFESKGGVINGRSPEGTVWTDYISDHLESANGWGHDRPADSPDAIAAATEGAARTNPSRPSADIPANLLELGALSHAMRNAPSTLGRMWQAAGALGRANLYVEFGLKPIVGDLIKVLDLKRLINQRVKELQRLRSEKGLRRTVTVYDGSTHGMWNAVVQSNFQFFTTDAAYITSERVRVHCRWYPAAFSLPWETTDDDMVKQAYKALLGLDLTQWDTYWEALPWSWLIDWMSTCGQYFRATRNIIPARLGAVTVMRHTRTEWNFGQCRNGDAVCSPAHVVREDKDRVLAPVSPSATLTFLTPGQMGIVSSLAVQRLR